MKLEELITESIPWNTLEPIETKGETGVNISKEYQSGKFRVRLSEYSANYQSAEWCDKGHIIHCIEGEITLHFKQKEVTLRQGSSIVIADGDSHIASTKDSPVRLFIID